MSELFFKTPSGDKHPEDEAKVYDLIILGGGPAGLTAAIYATRAKLDTLVIEKAMPGGYISTTDWIENYPGFADGISGMELSRKMEEHAKKFGAKIIQGEVTNIELKSEPKLVETNHSKYRARTIIIATGNEPKKLNVPGEEKFRGRGVSYCATCDGPFFKDKDIVIVGCGNSGLQEGLYLLRFVKSITYVEFLPQMTAENILQERALKEPGMKFHLNHQLLSIDGEDKITSVTAQNRETSEKVVIPVQGIFFYVGLIPQTQFLKGKISMDESGYIIANNKTQISIPGVFAAGDVRQKDLRQIVTATSDGAIAAVMAQKYLEEKK
ncbi:MAG: thioredoxin-disulfide reductase [candidate division Zixibacteria bacterium]|nr:thioredoxin-disulfide reductase [candidate division Zixibacteria bacterium]